MFFKFFVVILCVYAGVSASEAQHECNCHSLEALKRYNFESGSKKCVNTSFLLCCTLIFPKVPPSFGFSSFTSIRNSRFCCFNYLNRIPNKQINECSPEMIKYIDIASIPSSNNISTFIHNITLQPLFQPSIEKSLLPNAIMLFFSLFFIFAYCFASLKKDYFRAGYSNQTPTFIPPQPPHYESLPKDPPNYSSIFGPSHFPLTNLPLSSTHSSRQPSFPNYPMSSTQQANNLQSANVSEVFIDSVDTTNITSNNIPNTPNNSPQNLSTPFIDTRILTSLNQSQENRSDPNNSQPEVSIYATPLSVIFLNEFSQKKHQNIAQKVKTMFRFLKDPKKKPEVVVSSSLMTSHSSSNDMVPLNTTPHLKPSSSLPITSSPTLMSSQPTSTTFSNLSPLSHDTLTSQQQQQQIQVWHQPKHQHQHPKQHPQQQKSLHQHLQKQQHQPQQPDLRTNVHVLSEANCFLDTREHQLQQQQLEATKTLQNTTSILKT